MVEKIFFAILGAIFIVVGSLLIFKQKEVIINIYNKRTQGVEIFRKLRTPQDKMISKENEKHGRHICLFIGISFIIFGVLFILLKALGK